MLRGYIGGSSEIPVKRIHVKIEIVKQNSRICVSWYLQKWRIWCKWEISFIENNMSCNIYSIRTMQILVAFVLITIPKKDTFLGVKIELIFCYKVLERENLHSRRFSCRCSQVFFSWSFSKCDKLSSVGVGILLIVKIAVWKASFQKTKR